MLFKIVKLVCQESKR